MNRGQDESYKSGQRMMWPDTLPANRPERCRCSATLCGRRKQGHPEDDFNKAIPRMAILRMKSRRSALCGLVWCCGGCG